MQALPTEPTQFSNQDLYFNEIFTAELKESKNVMANIKSQKKRILTNEKARLRNKSVKSSLKSAVRKFREAADSGDAAAANEAARAANRELDIAVRKGVIHSNQAANRKSSISKKAASL